ncbi:MAG: hydrogenase expression/formation protein HypE, partial [Campylobacterota bacterium]|nr:hydrogenase expression/formation protein HypE [Campylobacterota bacterium]
ILKMFENNSHAAVIAEVTDLHVGRVILNSSWGTKRFLDTPSGELLPRIC